METASTTSSVDITAGARDEAKAVVEELLGRDQGMFDSAEVLSTLDLVDIVVALTGDAEPAKLAALSEVSAAGRAKARRQPLLDAMTTKGSLLLDIWAGLERLR
jgi:hypothetical protein